MSIDLSAARRYPVFSRTWAGVSFDPECDSGRVQVQLQNLGEIGGACAGAYRRAASCEAPAWKVWHYS